MSTRFIGGNVELQGKPLSCPRKLAENSDFETDEKGSFQALNPRRAHGGESQPAPDNACFEVERPTAVIGRLTFSDSGAFLVSRCPAECFW